ncbi:MAG TPA: GntR family transcriptional regulator, partial [Burkholderiaceae bacterium]|nr:GntR family transcriptional regulator [Burkholderiaceae bacterium]
MTDSIVTLAMLLQTLWAFVDAAVSASHRPAAIRANREEPATVDLYDDLIIMLSPPAALIPAARAERLVAERLSDRLAALLRGQIDAGLLRPGDRLPTETQLALAHGVSRTVVREAVHQLRSHQLVHARQGSGVYVALAPPNLPLAFDPSVLDSVQAVMQVVEVRRALEGEMAALAAERATRAQIACLRRALKAIDAAAAEG